MKHQTLCALLAAATLVSSEFSAIPVAAKPVLLPESQAEVKEDVPASSAAEVLEQVKTIPPVINEDGTAIILPESSSDQYEVQLYGSSNESVIDMNGTIHSPLEDMEVYVMYKVVNREDETDFALDQRAETSLVIPGRFTRQEQDNPRPDVLPAIQEWKGSTGFMDLADDARLVISSPALQQTAETIAEYFQGLLGYTPEISSEPARAGDIVLNLDEELQVLGQEGYTLDTADVAVISAPSAKGILYGGTTLVQILMQNENSLPKGMIRDYPAYEVRSCMQDVARFYMPLDYLEEVTKYMAFFKLNEFHVHINDNGGEQAHALRVESKKYPELNQGLNPDEVYSQEDYRNYQKEAARYGIEIVTEIDTPAHSGFIGEYDSSLMLDGYHIDLSNENVLPFIKSLLDEYLDGEDPVFQGTKFNIGTDEYNKDYSEDVRAYMNELIEYVSGKGREVRMWASLGTNGFNGITPVSNKAVGHYWSASWASYDEMLNMRYPCINNNDGNLYSVPGAGYYHDHIDLRGLYQTWEANYLVPSYHIARSNPLMLGSEAACWYDAKTGMSQFDVFDRTREQIALMAEKNWTGDRKEGQTADEFIARVDKLARTSPLANPARYVESQTDTVVSYDFENTHDTLVRDSTDNHYDGTITDLQVQEDAFRANNHVLELDGDGYLSMPFDSMGFPYSISFDLYLEKEQDENAVLFCGQDGILYANYEGTGRLAFQRKGYTYLFDIEVPEEVWTTILLTCDHSTARLYFNGIFAADAHYYKVSGASKEASSTFVLPLEEVGSAIHGALDNVTILNHASSYEEITGLDLVEYSNRALNRPVSVSGLEVQDGRFTAEMANDGDPATRVSLERKDDAWWQVDLEQPVTIDKIVINWSERPHSYQIQVSEDGENWTTVHEDLTCVEKSSGIETIQMTTPVNARYVRYQQLKQFLYEGNAYYSGNFREFEVWAFDSTDNPVLTRAAQLLETTEETDENRAILRRLQLASELYQQNTSFHRLEDMALILRKMDDLCTALENGVLWTDTQTDDLESLVRGRKNTDLFTESTVQKYLVAYRLALGTVLDGSMTQASVDAAVQRLRSCQDDLEIRPFIQASASHAIYQDNVPGHLLDQNSSTFYWQNGKQEAGDRLEFRFREPQNLYKIAINQDGCGGDVLTEAVVRISSDETNWTTVGTLSGTSVESVEFDPASVLMVRIELTKSAEKWWKMNEVIFNDGLLCDWYWLDQEMAADPDTEGCTTSSIARWQQTLEEARDLHQKENVTQKDIDTLLAALRQARENLEQIGDLTPVREVVSRFDQITADGYTRYSYDRLQQALDAARKLLVDPSDAGAITIERTVQTLEAAASGLKELINGVDTSLLDEALDNCLTSQGSASPNSWKSYQHLLEKAGEYAAGQGETITEEGIESFVEALSRTAQTLHEKQSENIALHKPVTCSGLEVDREDVRADKVTDGDLTTRIALHQKHDAWITIDLEQPAVIDRVIFRWMERPKQYKVQVSLDNENWTDVYENNNCQDHTRGDDIIEFAPVTARYVKYQQIEMQNIGYSGSCYEFEVYALDDSLYPDELETLISQGRDLRETLEEEQEASELQAILEQAGEALSGSEQEAVDQAADCLRNWMIEHELKSSTGLLKETIAQAEALENQQEKYTPDSWSSLQNALARASDVLAHPYSREAVETAQSSLLEALSHLVVKADKTLLEQAAAYARSAEEAGALEGLNELVVAEFHDALQAAETVLEDDNAEQNTVQEAWLRLVHVIHMLDFRTDKEELKALIEQAESLNLNLYADGESKEHFLSALEAARNVLNDPAALTDVSIKKAVEDLTGAMAALQLKADTSLLAWLISVVEDTGDSLYLDPEEFLETLAKAKEVLAQPADQQEVDDMVIELNRVWISLRLKPDEALLAELQTAYDALEALDLNLFTMQTRTRIQSVQAEIKSALENQDADQNQVRTMILKAESYIRMASDLPEPEKKTDSIQNTVDPDLSTNTEKEASFEPANKDSRSVKESVQTAAAFQTWSVSAAATAALASFVELIRKRTRK